MRRTIRGRSVRGFVDRGAIVKEVPGADAGGSPEDFHARLLEAGHERLYGWPYTPPRQSPLLSLKGPVHE